MRLENEEYNVLQVLSSKSKMDCWFDLREDDQGNDYVYDLEWDRKMSLCEGLTIFNDGLTDLEDYNLTQEEVAVYNNLIRRVLLK